MGLGGSAYCQDENWSLGLENPETPGVDAMGRIFFTKGRWDDEAATLISWLTPNKPDTPWSTLVSESWWDSKMCREDRGVSEDDASFVFGTFVLNRGDGLGTGQEDGEAEEDMIDLCDVLSCAALVSPRLRIEAKICFLCSMWSTHEDGHLGVIEGTDMFCAILRGLSRLKVLKEPPPVREDVENDVCRLLWVLRKQQPFRSDAVSVEEALTSGTLDVGLSKFLKAYIAAGSEKAPIESDGLEGRAGGRRAASAASQISSVTASAVLSRKEVLSAFDIFREIRTEQDRGVSSKARLTRAVGKIRDPQMQNAVRRLLARGQPLDLHDFLRMLGLSKSQTALTDAHLSVFGTWIAEKAKLTDSDLVKYRLERPLAPGAPRAKEAARAAATRKLKALMRRICSPQAKAWLRRQQVLLSAPQAQQTGPKPVDVGGLQDLTLTLYQMVVHQVVPGEMATAFSRTFGWDPNQIVTEGIFLEFFVPFSATNYKALDFMKAFRRAWLFLEQQKKSGASLSEIDDQKSEFNDGHDGEVPTESPFGWDGAEAHMMSWDFEDGGGAGGEMPNRWTSLGFRPPSRAHSAPARTCPAPMMVSPSGSPSRNKRPTALEGMEDPSLGLEVSSSSNIVPGMATVEVADVLQKEPPAVGITQKTPVGKAPIISVRSPAGGPEEGAGPPPPNAEAREDAAEKQGSPSNIQPCVVLASPNGAVSEGGYSAASFDELSEGEEGYTKSPVAKAPVDIADQTFEDMVRRSTSSQGSRPNTGNSIQA